MKKIALLLTIVCAGQLYGMEPSVAEAMAGRPEKGNLGDFEQLPEEVHGVIVKALATSNDLEQTIEAIKVASALQGVQYDNLKDFTTLVHILADKFDIPTAEVAQQFGTPMANTYYQLGSKLRHAVKVVQTEARYNEIIALIKDGADVNFSNDSKNFTPLNFALNNDFNVEVIKTLLNDGAKPTTHDLFFNKSLAARTPDLQARKEIIKQLLEEASAVAH